MKFALFALTIGLAAPLAAASPSRPNILVILADDMGYSDLGCFGSEIPTPNLDSLAAQGIRLTNLHNNARCCPSRASLVTGLYSHRTGMGYMTGVQSDFPGYGGVMVHPHSSIARVAASAGYFTGISGKWHLEPGDPKKEGFERADTVTPSGTSYFYPFDRSGSKRAGAKPTAAEARISSATYVTDWYADGVLNYLRDTAADKRPFLIYWTPTAPHYPLQCKQSDLDTMRGKYDAGPKAIAEARYQKLLANGLVDKGWPFAIPKVVAEPDTTWRTDVRTDADAWPPPPGTKFYNSKNEAMGCARGAASFEELMEIYAAQVSSLDQQVGRVIAALKADGRLEDTLIVFCSDNGASNENQSTGQAWAQVSNTPFPRYKRYTDGGGVRTSGILHWPARIPAAQRGTINRSYAHLIDIMPTVLEVTGATYPTADGGGRPLPPLPGRSLLPLMAGEPRKLTQPLCFEHDGNLAVVDEHWKLIGRNGAAWRLYNMETDPLETKDVAAAHPEIVQELRDVWQRWADENLARPAGLDAKGRDRL